MIRVYPVKKKRKVYQITATRKCTYYQEETDLTHTNTKVDQDGYQLYFVVFADSHQQNSNFKLVLMPSSFSLPLSYILSILSF